MQRKGILQFLKNCLEVQDYNKVIGGERKFLNLVETFLSELYIHYVILDIEKFCNHELRFSLLYYDKCNLARKRLKVGETLENLTFQQMAEKTHSELDGFKDWVKKYNKTAFLYMVGISRKSEDYKTILNEYTKSDL